MSDTSSDTPTTFEAFALDPGLVAAVQILGFENPTPIQVSAIPVLMDGHDVVGGARTGSGKTAAFGLPMLHRLRDGGRVVRALILAPTRELAVQVTEALRSFAKKLPVKVVTIYGGTSYEPQLRALRSGVSVVVGTPGRVLDHLKRGSLDLSAVEYLVLDEADEMLRMGFLDDVEAILEATPAERQTALFSATMPDAIRAIARRHLRDPREVQVEDTGLSVGHIEQRWMRVPQQFKVDALERVLTGEPHGTALVFARTRMGCQEVADALAQKGMAVDALHGDLTQAARERVLARLRSKQLSVVIATDVAARGIDVQHITHVINLDVPDSTESYVHRIGRTSRAGERGVAITFVTPKAKRRIHELAHSLRVEIKQVEVPSNADIVDRQRESLQRDIRETLDSADLLGARSVLTQLAAETAFSAEDLTAAAIHLLAKQQGLTLTAERDEAVPDWTRQRETDRGPKNFVDLNEVELFFPIGRRDGVNPSDFVGALANEGGLPGSHIGRITIVDRKTFVGLSRADAQFVLSERSVLGIRGHEVPLSIARPREAEENPHRKGPGWPERKRHGQREERGFKGKKRGR